MPEYKTGDIVLVKSIDKEYQGILMPNEYSDSVVVKLDNGYNIGIDKKKILSIKLIEKYKPKTDKKSESKPKKDFPTVSVLSTGGTISSKIDYRTGGVSADYTAEDFVEMCPELKDIANIRAKKVMSMMTEDMVPDDWEKMSKYTLEELNKKEIDGVVLTIGTDTLHFAASALSFMIKDINKPIIITASQRSIDRGSSDAFMNLICAVTAAAKFDGAVVTTCLHGTTNDDYCILIRGTKVRKMHTSRRDAFRPINELPLAKVYPNGKLEVINNNYKKRTTQKPELDSKFEEKTALIQVYPGMDPEILDFYIKKGFKGIVLSATALGHVPVNGKSSLLPNIKKAAEKGVHIIIASQTLYGRTHPYVYSNLRKLSIDNKCIFVEDMLPETAYIKLGWILAKTTKHEEVKELMQKNIAGEINKRHNPESFLY
ncbi:MAG: Glu-tRNA(Gln) amidotransferase subunit GatD [Candidatus Woesearchaeota archaeon]